MIPLRVSRLSGYFNNDIMGQWYVQSQELNKRSSEYDETRDFCSRGGGMDGSLARALARLGSNLLQPWVIHPHGSMHHGRALASFQWREVFGGMKRWSRRWRWQRQSGGDVRGVTKFANGSHFGFYIRRNSLYQIVYGACTGESTHAICCQYLIRN